MVPGGSLLPSPFSTPRFHSAVGACEQATCADHMFHKVFTLVHSTCTLQGVLHGGVVPPRRRHGSCFNRREFLPHSRHLPIVSFRLGCIKSWGQIVARDRQAGQWEAAVQLLQELRHGKMRLALGTSKAAALFGRSSRESR